MDEPPVVRRTATVVVAAVAVAISAAVVIRLDPTGVGVEGGRDGRGEGASVPVRLPGGWSPAPEAIETLDGAVVPATPGSGPVVAVGRDVLRATAGGAWTTLAAGRLPHAPDLVAAAPEDDGGWVLALSRDAATLIDGRGQVHDTDALPEELRGDAVLGAAWAEVGFVVVAKARSATGYAPAHRLWPDDGRWERLPDLPLAVNHRQNTSVVRVRGAVMVTGAWLDANNAPARDTLGAAVLTEEGRGTWQLVEGGGAVSPQLADAAPVDDRVLVVDGRGDAAWVSAEGWSTPTATGLPGSGSCLPKLGVNRDGDVLAVACHDVAAYRAGDDAWHAVAPPTAGTGSRLRFSRPVGVGERFLVPRGHGVALDGRPDDVLTVALDGAWPLAAAHDGRLARPPGWTVASDPLTPNLAGRVEVASASTADLPAGGACAQIPGRALEALGPRDVLVTIQRQASSGGVRPRDSTMPVLGGLGSLPAIEDGAAIAGCASTSDELDGRFQVVHGLGEDTLLVWIVHGTDAPESRIDQAHAIVNSYRP